MTKLFTLIAAMLFVAPFTFSQGCENADFEYGNFTGWEGYTGTTGQPILTPGFQAGRHTIITSNLPDPNTNGDVPMLSPNGGTHSVRLGNSNVGGEAERMSKTITVNNSNKLFIYQYALVLEDPYGHTQAEKPKFIVTVRDQNGDLIFPAQCSYYEVTAGPETDSFQVNGTVRYKNWSTVGLDLSAQLGTTVTIDFSVQDCGLGGHFGYAYIDASCEFAGIEVVGFCTGADSVTLIAPEGFNNYFWPATNETGRSISIPRPNLNDSVIVQCTNESGCMTPFLKIFEDLPLVQAEVNPDTTICVGENLLLTANPGYPEGKFEWFANGVSFSHSQSTTVRPDSTTTYTVVVSNPNGCYSPDSSASVVVTVDRTLFYGAPNDTLLCPYNTLNFTGVNAGTSHLWRDENNNVLSTTINYTLSADVSKYIVYEVSNATCSFMDSTFVEVASDTAFPAVQQLYYCQGETNFELTALPGSFDYTWETGDTTASIFIDPSLYDTVRVYYFKANCPGADTTDFVLNEQTFPTVTVDVEEDTACFSRPYALRATSSDPNAIFTWSIVNGPVLGTGNPYQISVYNTDSYAVEVSANGCSNQSSMDTMRVVVDSSAYFELPQFVMICDGQADSVRGPANFDAYNWYYNGNPLFNTNPSIPVQSQNTGIYELTGTKNGCSFTDATQIRKKPVYSIDFPVPVCENVNQITLTHPYPQGYTSHYWAGFNNSNDSNVLYNPSNGQVITLYATKTNGCVDTLNQIIEVLAPSILNPQSDTSICFGESFTKTGSSSSTYDVYTWTNLTTNASSSSVNFTESPSSTTNYTLTLSNSYNCVEAPKTVNFTVDVKDKHMIPSIPSSIGCDNTPITITSPVTVGTTTWNYNGQTGTNNTFTFLPTSGNSSVQLITSYLGCKDTALLSVQGFSTVQYTISSSETYLCEGQPTTFSISPDTYTSITWNTPDGTEFANSAPILVYPIKGDTYTIHVVDDNGCPSTATYNQAMGIMPAVELGPNRVVCGQDFVVLNDAPPIPDAQYTWSNGLTTPSIEASSNGTYIVEVESDGCMTADTVELEIYTDHVSEKIPNVFSPNEDGTNDYLTIQNQGWEEFELRITNRWGNLVFETSDYKDTWNGKQMNEGEMLHEGVYFYLLDYKRKCDTERQVIKGDITIVK